MEGVEAKRSRGVPTGSCEAADVGEEEHVSDSVCAADVVKTSVEARELRSARRLARFERLASTRTVEGFYAARLLWGWAPRFGGHTCRKQTRTRQERGREEKRASATPQAVKPRRQRWRRARPSGLPNGRVRVAPARENKVRRCVRRKRVVGRLAPRRMRSPHMQDAAGLTDGLCLLDFGSRLGRWHKKCLQAAVLGLCRDSARDVLKTGLSRTRWNNRRSVVAGG